MRQRPARRHPGDFQRQLPPEGRSERIVAVGGDEKRAWAADHIGLIPVLDAWLSLRGDRQPVHGNPVGYRSIPRISRRHLAGILPAVARDVDHPPQTDKGFSGEQLRGSGNAAARIGHCMYPGPARAAQMGCQRFEVIPPAKDNPRHQDALFLRPFDNGNLDRLIDAAQDRRNHLFALERGGDTFALELEAIFVDRAGDVDRQHQSHIGSMGSRGYAERHS